MAKTTPTMKEARAKTLAEYIELVRELGRVPTNAEMQRAGLRTSTWKKQWGGFEKLDAAARRKDPKAFGDIRVVDASKRLPKAKRYVITTAVAGAQAHGPFLMALRNYAERYNAQLGIMVCEDPATPWSRQNYLSIDSTFAGIPVVAKHRQELLNENLKLISMKVSAKQIDPTTGVDRLAALGQSLVLASPKQRQRPIPGPGHYPQAVFTTGACTLPHYDSTDLYLSKRTAFLAEEDHVVGALIIEVEDRKRFHVRHIQAAEDGCFIDMGKLHRPRGAPKKVRPEGIVWGDIHAGHEDPIHFDGRERLVKLLRPKQQVVHDLYPGEAISHWIAKMLLTKAHMAERGETCLRTELETTRLELKKMAKWAPVVVAKSNHDEWLDRYLESGDWLKDSLNAKLAHGLAGYMLDGLDPLATYLGDVPGVTWLKRATSYRIANHECAYHGDKGTNGARNPGLRSFEGSLGKCVVAHNHGAEVLRAAKRVGTSTKLRMGYNVGPSSWSNSHIALYMYEGQDFWQMHTIIDGYYCIKGNPQ